MVVTNSTGTCTTCTPPGPASATDARAGTRFSPAFSSPRVKPSDVMSGGRSVRAVPPTEKPAPGAAGFGVAATSKIRSWSCQLASNE
jgi:hypothetical protein